MTRSENVRLLVVMLAVLVITIGQQIGGALEARLWPIIARQAVSPAFRDGDFLCWLWQSSRERYGRLANIDVFIHVNGQQSDVVPASLLVREGGDVRYLRASLSPPPAPGQLRERVFCIDWHRAQLDPDASISVRVTMHYLTWHTLWQVAQPLPLVRLPGGPGM